MSNEYGTIRLTAVARADLLEESALREAQASAQRSRVRLDQALADMTKAQATYGVRLDVISAPPFSDTTREQCEAFIRKAAAAVSQARAEIARAAPLAELQRVLASASARSRVSAQPKASDAPRSTPSGETPDLDKEKVIALIDRVIGRAPALVLKSASTDFGALIDKIIAAKSDNRESLILDLRSKVQTAHDAQRAFERGCAQAGALLEEMRGLEDTDLDGLREELFSASAGEAPFDESLRERADAATEAARKRFDAARTGEIMHDVLKSLGYAVGPEFVTAVVKNRKVVIPMRRMGNERLPPSIAIELEAKDGGVYDFEMVRMDDVPRTAEQDQRDMEAGEAWCSDFDNFKEFARRAGLEVNVKATEGPHIPKRLAENVRKRPRPRASTPPPKESAVDSDE